ncbi:hypothetical protein HA052_18795 [Chromobacterium haemolyticum]|uniref:Uncharacterized protein n=1 Tax=Chromobacterium fluminis TaxID=3044269 RepID=A0ABX0LCJ9_9NEIS|nr:hypothetical protein [Chromobacterium haemolyticum]NHR07242.1 hypothetical protein [Chromobacterium haemolyticum]
MKNFKLWLLLVGVLVSYGSFAGSSILFTDDSYLKRCENNASICSYDKGQAIRNKFWVWSQCLYSQPYHITIKSGKGDLFLKMNGRVWGFGSEHTNPIVESRDPSVVVPLEWPNWTDIDISLATAGIYILEFKVDAIYADAGNRLCEANVYKYGIEIKPTISKVRLEVKLPQDHAKGGGAAGHVSIPYGNRSAIKVMANAYENEMDLNESNMRSCNINAGTNSEKTKREKDGEYFSYAIGNKEATVFPEYVERGKSVTLSGTCEYSLNGYVKTVQIESLTLTRETPNFGSPRLQWSDSDRVLRQFDWARGAGDEAKNLKIKVVSTQLNQKNLSWDYCQIAGTGVDGQSYSFSEKITAPTSETQKPLDVERLGKGQTAPGGSGKSGSATFSGTCYEDEKHWDYYSQPLDPIALQRLAPRIITQMAVNQGEVKGKLANSPREVHPGEVFSVDASASLTNFYPGVKFSVALSDNSLAEITSCEKFGMRSNNICLLAMPATKTESGKVTGRAASKDKVKVKKLLAVKMNVESQDLNDVSDVITLASTQIEIVPQITVRGRSNALDVKIGDHSVNAKNIVLHQGRELEVTLSNYRLIGDMPGGRENGQTSGELKALTVALPPELDKTARPKWAIAAAALTDADAAWTGHDTATKLNSQAVKYGEDQPLKVIVPIKVTGDATKKVELKISGQYGTPQAEVLNPLGSDETMVTIDIGDKLLPADKVFSMNVNQAEALQLSHNPPNNLNYVEVHFKAAKDVSGVDLRVDLPEGLQRGVHGELQLLKNNVIFKSENCPNSCLVNEWRKSGAVVSSLSMSKDDAFNLKIPVELTASALATLHPIAIAIEQNDERVNQDTKERVVEWKTANSMLEMSKPVIVKSREQVDVHEMDPELQVADENGKTFRAVVDVMNVDATDKVTLKGGNQEWEMKAVAVDHAPSNQKRYEATNVPMLKRLSDTLTVVVKPGGADPVLKRVVAEEDVNRALTCRAVESDCTLIWRGARVPYFHSAKDNALEFNLSNLGKETWFDKLYQLSVRADPWTSVSLFLPKNYTLPLLNEDSGNKTQSFMLDGTLPQEGDFHFDYVH